MFAVPYVCYRFYQAGEMILVAKRMIRKGEEISNNYGIHHNNQVSHYVI